MTRLRLGLLQYQPLRCADVAAWLAHVETLTAQAAGEGAQILVLPEYAALDAAAAGKDSPDLERELVAGCDLAPALLRAMAGLARRHRVWLLPGTLPMRIGGAIRNCATLFDPEGRSVTVEKRVMTRFEAERWGISAGQASGVVATPWGRIGIAICYEVEFPLLVRPLVAAGAFLVLVPSCTDSLAGCNRVRLSARARALENQCYVAVAPVVGVAPHCAALDVNRGQAGVYGPVDHGFAEDGVISEGVRDRPGWIYADLDPGALATVRADGAVRNHRDWNDTVAPAPLMVPA